MEISPVIYCMAKRGCPAAELSLPWLWWGQRFVKELSGSKSMARCSGDLSSAISGCLVTLGREGFFTSAHQSYRHGPACSLLTPELPKILCL